MTPPVPPPLPVKTPLTWWQRHWVWLAILGGAALLAVITLSSLALMNFVTGKLRQSEPYQIAMAAAQRDATVAEALGTPWTPSRFITGAFNESSQWSFVQLSVPITGPKAKGTLQVVASKNGDEWSYQILKVVVLAPPQTIPLKAEPRPQ